MKHLALLSVFTLASCAITTDDELCDEGKCDQPAGNGNTFTTANNNLDLYTGYHSLFDKTASKCVELDGATKTAPTVGSVHRVFEAAFVSSRDELAKEIGVDLGLKVKYVGVSGDLGVNLLSKFKSTSTSLSLLLKIEQDYSVQNKQELKLNAAGVAKLKSGAGPFVQACGSNYINGIRYGGQLFVLVTFEADTVEKAMELRTQLGGSGGIGPVAVTADLKTKVNTASTKSGVKATLRVVSRGFDMGGTAAGSTVIQDFVGATFNAQTFAKLDEVRTAMQVSLDLDACRDSGQGTCGGEKSPGYAENKKRKAQASGAEVGFYDALINVENPKAFKAIRERLNIIERYVRDWAEIEERMALAYYNELAPFTAASASDKARYNVAPPGVAQNNPTALRDIADAWSEKFAVLTGTTIGSSLEVASNKIADCWGAASVDIFHKCEPNDVQPLNTDAWKKLFAEIDTYKKQGRVLPLDYKVGNPVSASKAAAECTRISTPTVKYRLASKTEAPVLATLIGFGPIAWGGDEINATWVQHASPTSVCPNPDLPHPFFRNRPGDGAPSFGCGSADGVVFAGTKLTPICVPSGGPIALTGAP